MSEPKTTKTWAYINRVDGLENLIGQFQEFPKSLNTALRRAGRKSMTKVLQVMRTKVKKKGKKIKRKRRATVMESLRDFATNAKATLAQKLFGLKRRKRKAKQYTQRDLQTGRTGLLRKSLGSKVAVNKKTGQVYAMAGPRRKKDGFIGEAWSPWLKKMVKVVPSKYAHLVERGFGLKIRGKVVKRVPGNPFVRPAFDEVKGQIEGETRTVLQEELDKLFAKKAARESKEAAKLAMGGGGA